MARDRRYKLPQFSDFCGIPGGEAGIRTLGTAIQPYNGLANRRLKPLGHLSSHGSLDITTN